MKVGIITHYYKSENYGGNLQAWALCEVIKDLGHEVEQISYDRNKNNGILALKIKAFRLLKLFDLRMTHRVLKRRRAFDKFNKKLIPHSSDVYSEKNIRNCVSKYDAFVSGSDQVWHPIACSNAYLLKFVPSDKIKLSYAASVSHNKLTEAQLQMYKIALADFKAVSVREEDTVDLLSDVSPVPIHWCLDPTLLLSSDKWEKLYVQPKVKDKYIFCYFLGNNKKQRIIAEEFARKNNIKIVTIPNISNGYNKDMKKFGDIVLNDATPNDFISYIRDSEYVFTDSFHAVAFSLIFKKQYFVFHRSEFKSMSNRISSLISLFDACDHFCNNDDKESLAYIESISPIEYSKDFERFQKKKNESLAFLTDNLSF